MIYFMWAYLGIQLQWQPEEGGASFYAESYQELSSISENHVVASKPLTE